MAGILPFCYNPINDKIYYLLGRESHTHPTDSKLYSDFGGSKEGSENKISTAAREGYEETQGIFGSEGVIKSQLSKLPKSMILSTKKNTYTTYLYKINYIRDLPQIMNRLFYFMKRNLSNVVDETNGFFEKDHHMLVTLDEIKKKYSIIRPFYREIISKIDESKIRNYLQVNN
jgi:hypothetical protein